MSTHVRTNQLIVPAVLAAAMLSACGGDESMPPSQPGEALGNLAAHLAVVTSQASIPLFIPHVPTGPAEVGPDVVLPPFQFLCTSGGTREPGTVSRISPYAQLPIEADRIVYSSCLQYHDPANPARGSTEMRGVEERGQTGSVVDGGLITYQQDGNADGSMPREFRLTAPDNDGLLEHSEIAAGRIDSLSSRSGSSTLRDATIVRSHEIFVLYSNGSRFEGRYRLGTAALPFRVRSRDFTTRLSGAYEIDTGRCHSGTMRVETGQDLVYDDASDSFSGGLLRFVAEDGSTATATFLGGGRVRIVDADGSASVIGNWRHSLAAWSNECFGEWAQ